MKETNMLTKSEIKALVDEYPFLWPTHVYDNLVGKRVEDYDYSYCELSYLPEGWIKSFIPRFLHDLKSILIKNNQLDKYFVVTTRALGGYFNWVGNIETPEITNLILKYRKEISKYCYFCGSSNIKYKSTWNMFMCPCCAKKDFDEFQKTVDYTLNFDEEFELIS